MAEASIPVNLFNPGQVFACLGFLEAAETLVGNAEGGFDWSNELDIRFRLRANGGNNPFDVVLTFLKNARVEWLSPDQRISERDGGPTVVEEGIASSATPKSADLPGRLISENNLLIQFGYWADGSGRFSATFKKSTNGASSHVRLKNALSAVVEILSTRPHDVLLRPFDISWRTESLFRIDPRGSVDPINAGFSADSLRKGNIDMRIATYPIAETLAIVGLQHARPIEISRHSFRYYVWGQDQSHPHPGSTLLPLVLGRAALSGSLPFLPRRSFVVQHEEVKRGGDRKMTEVTEENNS